MADVEAPQSGYRDLGGAPPVTAAPDLYQALGGQLTSLNEQLAGFQQELAGMGRDVPPPSIVPPNVSSPMGQVGSVLAALFSPMAGIENPVTAKQEAYRKQQMEGSRERRSILQQRLGVTKEQAALVQAQADLERHRQEQQDAPLKFVPGLLSIKTPAAMQMAGQLMEDYFTRKGVGVPSGFAQGLINKEYSFEDIRKIVLAREMGHDPAVIKQAFTQMPPAVFQSIWDKKIPDHLMKAIDPHWKTEVEREKEALDLKEKTRASLQKALGMNMPGMGATNESLIGIDAMHMLKNGGQHWVDGTEESKRVALADWNEQKNNKVDPVTRALEIAAGKRGTTMLRVAGGAGDWYDKKTDQYRNQVSSLDLDEPNRYIAITPQKKTIIETMKTAMNDMQRLRVLVPEVLSKYPVDNIRQYLANQLNTYTGADPLLTEFMTLTYRIPIEDVRAIGGSSTVRQGLYNVLQKHSSVRPLDTQKTALQMIDSQNVLFYNAIARVHETPLLSGGRRIGPGRWWAYPVDPVTGGPNKKGIAGDGKPSAITVPQGKFSDPGWYVMEVVD